jgi:phenylpropionate dioxygenase-like ring-hydroxylating dioxygenase large terminal subunit
MVETKSTARKQTARCPAVSWRDIMAGDAKDVPTFLAEDNYQYLGSKPLDPARYTSPQFHAAEVEKMWPNVWQFAAREEEMPAAGDYVTYENAGRSFLLVRQKDGSVRAFHNVCLHRGRKLKTGSGSAQNLFCPFHGFSWTLDGALQNIPCRWDFDHLSDAKMKLPEAEVGRWGGYIFVRDNPGGPSLLEYLAPVPEHFKRWKHEECATVAWVAKVIRANWKVTMEAFMESYHVIATHPQLMSFMGDANAAYNNWGDNVNANYAPFGVLSPHLDPTGKSQQWIADEFVKFNGRSADNYDANKDPNAFKVPEGTTARRALGEVLRETSRKAFGRDHTYVSDSELVDALVYNVFPNFAPWGGFMPNIVYRWRPWPDQDHCLMEARVLSRVKPGEPIPKSVPMHMLSDSEPWTAAAELGVLGAVFEQDMANMALVHEGLKVSKNREVQLGNYQEIRIRQFHETIDKYLARKA